MSRHDLRRAESLLRDSGLPKHVTSAVQFLIHHCEDQQSRFQKLCEAVGHKHYMPGNENEHVFCSRCGEDLGRVPEAPKLPASHHKDGCEICQKAPPPTPACTHRRYSMPGHVQGPCPWCDPAVTAAVQVEIDRSKEINVDAIEADLDSGGHHAGISARSLVAEVRRLRAERENIAAQAHGKGQESGLDEAINVLEKDLVLANEAFSKCSPYDSNRSLKLSGRVDALTDVVLALKKRRTS